MRQVQECLLLWWVVSLSRGSWVIQELCLTAPENTEVNGATYCWNTLWYRHGPQRAYVLWACETFLSQNKRHVALWTAWRLLFKQQMVLDQPLQGRFRQREQVFNQIHSSKAASSPSFQSRCWVLWRSLDLKSAVVMWRSQIWCSRCCWSRSSALWIVGSDIRDQGDMSSLWGNRIGHPAREPSLTQTVHPDT